MTIRPLSILPAPVLRKLAEPVITVDDDIRQLMNDMLETMRHEQGLGGGAPARSGGKTSHGLQAEVSEFC